MSADLHVVLSYNPVGSTLTAQFYTSEGVLNSALPVPIAIVATYRFFRDGVNIGAPVVGGTSVTITAVPPPVCGTVYSVIVSYSAGGNPQPDSQDSITVGTDYIYGGDNYIYQTTIPGGIMLNLVPPVGVVPTNIVWAQNYEILDLLPANTTSFIAQGNGIYEVAFQDSITGLSYYGIVEVTGSSPAQYVRITGNDGNLYGTFGTPLNVDLLTFTSVGGNSPYRSRIYVNGVQYSDNNFINIENLAADDLIYYYSVDNCGIILSANTFILSCGVIPLVTRTAAQTALDNYPRPGKDVRPPRLPSPPTPQAVFFPDLPIFA